MQSHGCSQVISGALLSIVPTYGLDERPAMQGMIAVRFCADTDGHTLDMETDSISCNLFVI
jgi:hypothetical protein